MEENLREILEKVCQLSQQNPEFDVALRERLKIASANSVVVDDERINEIYELCIEKVVRKQAAEFYADFPIKGLIPQLEEDFIRMEFFRRKDNFGDFCLALYQQIECMTNHLCERKELEIITSTMWGCSPYVFSDAGTEPRLDNRLKGKFLIANLIFPQGRGQDAFERSQRGLQTQAAIHKCKTVVYFLGYRAKMKSSDYDAFIEISEQLSNIYQCRNWVHRGGTSLHHEKENYEKIYPLKSFYYFKFIGVLTQYIEYVKKGFPFIPELVKYCETIGVQKVPPPQPQLKVKGYIALPEDPRKR